MSDSVLIIGTGAQAKYAIEIFTLIKMPVSGLICLSSDKPAEGINGVDVLGSMDDFKKIYSDRNKPFLLLANSSNKVKEELSEKLSGYSPAYINAIHPSAVIATTAQLGRGIIINPNAVIQPNAKIGNHVMIHAGVIVEHDCVVGDYVNLAPRAVLAGHAKVGKGTTVYTGAVIIPVVEIGEYSKVGAGAVLLKSIGDNVTVAGIPALPVKSKKKKK